MQVSTMQAMLIEQFGGPQVFRRAQIGRPQLAPGHVLIDVAASSVNPVDTKIRANGPGIAPILPAVLHGDVAGRLIAVADDVQGFAPGDEIFACAGGVRGLGGSLAEVMLADARLLAPKPKSLDMAAAAALPLVTITAWEGLYERGALKPGERVLVIGGTGGVGHIAVQLARRAGAWVASTASSPEKARIARELGAHEVILHRNESITDGAMRLSGGEGFDLTFDAVGGDKVLPQAFSATRLGGRIVTIQARANVDLAPLHDRAQSLHAEFMLPPLLYGRGREHHGEILRKASILVDAGELKPLLDERRFGFTEVGAAHAHLESGQAHGKVALINDLTN
ncbi:zinc-dependent alcohol dehydrogenase family protein [Algiphilus sp. W345]|uniref:Zinc-dependent alcohol dehydrogenase family protein n=1 Tax=Banduia mediterranea TaxID=3075609 RepID=A0ABU2WDP3_9GAMM|nr:zinc-dependent alcohol dehydrogenase family protein [Algiphilus sp. W345]MDT0495996.1 zinc-dependent alcohol dehydrogenase family protein [Algiphilus sp. W345]